MSRLYACCLLLLALVGSTLAQLPGSTTLTGRVTDPSGAIITSAEVAITDTRTNVQRSTRTNRVGQFSFTNIAPGEYDVAITAPKFVPTKVRVELAVGREGSLDVPLRVSAETTTLEISDKPALSNTLGSVVDGVIATNEINSLPLNGRNYLELAFLIPGNAPAPNFDPTKTDRVTISSAGQLGRGGNVTVDGADNSDDVVGGPLQNIPQDAVQEFQIATNRFSAELGRSGSSVANVVTRSGSNELHGGVSFFERDAALQGLPATFDRSLGETPPFRRQHYAANIGGPLVRDKAWWFDAFEFRDQLGGVLVGERNFETRTIQRTFAPAPLQDLLGTTRADWQVSPRDALSLRYSLELEDDTAASTLTRSIGSASQRQASSNHFQSFLASWTRNFSPTLLNRFSFSVNNFFNSIAPVVKSPQLTFPSLQDGASFRVPQQTGQNRLQFSDGLSWSRGRHNFQFGADVQRIDANFFLGVFQQGRVELVEDFPDFDRNGDGRVDDNDLLFAVTLRSAFPDRPLVLPDADNNYIAGCVQDDWRLHPQFTLNIGLRYELDTDVNNVSRYSQLNPIVQPFSPGARHRDTNNFGPRIGFNWATRDGRLSIRGGYGIYYDRVTLEVQSLERGLDGRALPIEVRAGNVMFLDPTGHFAPGAPTLANPFTGFIFPGAGAAGINVIDNHLQNPEVQQFHLGVQREIGRDFILSADGLHNLGTHFILGRTVGTVFNPVIGGEDIVKKLESSVNTHYDALLLSVRKRFSHHYDLRAAYTLSKALNYANDDQIPFANGPIDPNNLAREYGPTPNDQRHRFTFSGSTELPRGFRLSAIWTLASGVPMDILMPDASTRVPVLQRNAGGRQFHSAGELNTFISQLNAGGGINGVPLPLVSPDARFNDSFNSLDLRIGKTFKISERARLEAIAEAFNIFNITNVLGVSNLNYSGFSNVLARDSNDPSAPGFLRSSSFGLPVTTAGGVFGSGGPRAFQLAAKFSF